MHTSCPYATQVSDDGTIDSFVAPGVPNFDSLSFEDAIRLFKQWGYQVEPGPRSEEVTLILEGPGFRNYSVHDPHMLTEMAAVALRARWQNGTLARRREEPSGSHRAASREFAELLC